MCGTILNAIKWRTELKGEKRQHLSLFPTLRGSNKNDSSCTGLTMKTFSKNMSFPFSKDSNFWESVLLPHSEGRGTIENWGSRICLHQVCPWTRWAQFCKLEVFLKVPGCSSFQQVCQMWWQTHSCQAVASLAQNSDLFTKLLILNIKQLVFRKKKMVRNISSYIAIASVRIRKSRFWPVLFRVLADILKGKHIKQSKPKNAHESKNTKNTRW
jgi:hypothetical protein